MNNNITLIWLPWSGKTTLWKILAKNRWMDFIDFDDDVIEVQTAKSVSEILEELWESWFKKLEEQLGKGLRFENTVFATSWSLPYSEVVMKHLSDISTRVYLKVPQDEILERAKNMKVDRIIGMGTMTLAEIFQARSDLYTQYADIVFEYSGSDIKKIAQDLESSISNYG